MTERRLVQVIIASTRPGRVGEPVARWVADQVRGVETVDVELVDLAEVGLPIYSEPEHPRSRRYIQETTTAFSELVDRAHGFVIVFPEYNHSYNAALKNALDHLYWEWSDKPVMLVSYGGVAAGSRAAIALQPVLLALRMRVAGLVPIPFVAELVHDVAGQRVFVPHPPIEQGTQLALDTLLAAL